MIRVEVHSKAFGDQEILRDINFAVEVGETFAILGPSGIGKSTLLGLISGMDKDFEGHIDCPKDLAFVFQEPTLLPWRTALQNLTLVHPDLSAKAALAALERVGIAGKAEQFPGQLSLGQQRRLSLARAFAGHPEALIMDEPFVSLDPKTSDEMMKLTEELIAEVRPATVFVTHSEAEAKRLATHIVRLEGEPATLKPASET